MTDSDYLAAVEHELTRVGLSLAELPGLAMASDAREPFLARLRTLPPGAGWRDVFPDLPPDWREWDALPRYRPLGAYDYAEPPAGPAVHIQWPDRDGDAGRLDTLVAAARAVGWPVYGAGLIPITNAAWPTMDALVVLTRGTEEDTLGKFVEWLEAWSDASLAAIPRRGTEQYR
ncbi:hypothetical protein J421_0593 [Gemmatirosa kalamazoonensis]|uniref:Uncharacterized protein n=1 Tax=Gemmatirosa kalamazoonensis TaxID=861299 RepID=W0RCT0_9BACT|nr:hypothetical protein [Gemmatirosa kalamazoonensis]AHG88130.1 hypothetical protein J421_0593 [Gemmatirosa kalamazoonensis]